MLNHLISIFILVIRNLIKICETNKKIHFTDINFQLLQENDYKNLYSKNDSSIGEILLRTLEAIPIQIAKIMKIDFEIIRDWSFIKNKINKKKDNQKK